MVSKQILIPDWLRSVPAQSLFDTLGKENVRFVGGAVRDTLLGRPVTDLDAACLLPPGDVMAALEQASIKAIPTGLKHGTVTALFRDCSIEITQLRRDMETDGRHATVAPTQSWSEDAARRDFTVNALYLDADGTLFDPCGGLRDIEDKVLRFIGDPANRIREDGLRILRYYRFLAQLGFREEDPAPTKVIRSASGMITKLSGERIAGELMKWLAADDPLPSLKAAAESRVFEAFPVTVILERLQDSLEAAKVASITLEPLQRLACFTLSAATPADQLQHWLKLSNAQTLFLKQTWQAFQALFEEGNRSARDVAYRFGLGPARTACVMGGLDPMPLAEWVVPILPLSARDLLDLGYSPGPEIGTSLKRLEEHWIASEFTADRADLISLLQCGQGED